MMPKVSYIADGDIRDIPPDDYTLTAKEIQSMIEFLAEKKIRLDKIKGYMNVKRSKIAHQK